MSEITTLEILPALVDWHMLYTQIQPPSFDLSIIDRANLQPSTREKYKRAIRAYLETGATLADSQSLAAYAQTLTHSGRAFLKAAVRLLAGEMVNQLKGHVTPDTLNQTHAALMRLEALTDNIKVKKATGEKLHTWLSPVQIKRLMNTCSSGTLEGRRDWIILGLLVGAGLRREELAALSFDAVITVTAKGKNRTVLQVKGKGAKDRTIPVNDALAARLAEWKEETGGGMVARSLGRAQELGERLSAVGVFDVVRKHGVEIGLSNLAPHDLRRSYAQNGYEAGVPITQISVLLGHSSVQTTQRYLNLSIDLQSTVSDFIPLV